MKKTVLLFLLVIAVVQAYGQGSSRKLESQLKLGKAQTEKDEVVVTLTLAPDLVDKEKVDIVSVYLLDENNKLSPEDVLKSCDKMGIFVDNDGVCFYSLVKKKPEETYVGQIAIRHADGVCKSNSVIVLHLPMSSPALRYEGSGKLHVWTKRDKERSSNIESLNVTFKKDREK